MARNLKELGALVVLVAERGEPRRATPEDRRRHSDRFDVIDRRRAAVEPRPRRKWRLEARLALLALEAFEHRGLFRSEEHTSELQSLMRISYAVFCLKKKK